MRRFMKKRSNSRSTVDKVATTNDEAEFINGLVKSNPPLKSGEDSGYGERERLHQSKMKSFSCENLIAVGSLCQDRRRQSTVNETGRINIKSTSRSSSSTSEEHIPYCSPKPYLCDVKIDGKGRCQLMKDDYNKTAYENESVKYRPKTSVHLKLSRNQSDTFRYQNVALRISGDLTSIPVLDDLECQKVEEAYEEALKYGAVDVTYVRLMLIGLPEAGKTTTRYSLMGEKAPHDLSRTKLVEPCQKPIRRQLAITGKSGWSYINHDQEDEGLAVLLNRLMSCNEGETRICSQKNSYQQDSYASLPVHSFKSLTSENDTQTASIQFSLPSKPIASRSNSSSPVNVLPLPPKPLSNNIKSSTIPVPKIQPGYEYTKGRWQTESQSTDEIYEDIESIPSTKSNIQCHSLSTSLQKAGESPQDVQQSLLLSPSSVTTTQSDTAALDLRARTQSMPVYKSRELSVSSTEVNQHRRSSNSKTPDPGKFQNQFLEQGLKFRQKIKQSVIGMLKEQDGLNLCTGCDNEVLINIWDCGGQFVFREILPAFLAQKVAYLLIYDASKDLEEVYKEPGTYPGCYAEGNTFQHLQKWMAAIHAHSTLLLPSASLYPRMLVIGTHGDALKAEEGCYEAAKQKIVSEIKAYFKGKRFADLVLAHFIVDNTTGGEGYDQEDPAFDLIRCQVEDYAKQSLTISTPVSWVLFRRVFQATITEAGIPVVSMSLAKEIAAECKIDEDTLSQVLVFYHQVGLLLHYASVPILDDVVIADPQWLVNSLSLLFTLPSSTDHEEELASLWTQLHEKGVLEQALYESIWANCGVDPQGLLNLLEYFLLAAPIKHGIKKLFSDSAYFVPSLLNSWASEEDSSNFEDAVKIAAPLFLVFNTEYVPPGFFIRLAASFSGVDGVEIMFDGGIYRNRITFAIGEADELTMVENLESIKITLARYFTYCNSGSLQFSQACQNAKQNLLACCFAITQQWMPGVKAITAFQCEKPQCSNKPLHYIHFDNTIKSCLRCSHSKIRTMPSESQKLWLQPANPVQDTKEEGISTKLLSKVAVKLNPARLEQLSYHLGIDTFQFDAIKEDHTKHYERAMAVLKEWYGMGKGGIGELHQSLQDTGHYQAARLLPVKHDSASHLSTGQSSHLPVNIGPFATHFPHRQMSFRKKYHTPTTNNSTKELTLSTIVQISSKINDENKLLLLAVLLGFTEQEFFDMQCDYQTTYLLALHMITKWWKRCSGCYAEFCEYLKAAGLSYTLP